VTEIKSSPAIKAVLSNGTTRTFCRTENIRPTQDGNFGAVRTMITETLTAVDGGIRVDSHAVGTVEGTHIDQRSSDFYLGVTMERAAAYRIRMGYHEVTPRETKRQLRVIRRRPVPEPHGSAAPARAGDGGGRGRQDAPRAGAVDGRRSRVSPYTLCLVTLHQARHLGMSAHVAGGWIATASAVRAVVDDSVPRALGPVLLALVPSDWDEAQAAVSPELAERIATRLETLAARLDEPDAADYAARIRAVRS